jgi:predicted nucleotidyltransferase
MKDLTPDSLEQMLTYLRTVVDDKGERINIKPTHYYTKENMKEINEAFDREYDKYKNSPEYKAFVKIKMPTYYIAKHSDEDLRAAVLKEREACIKLLEDFSKTGMVPAKDTWRMGLIAGANAIRGRTE